MPTMKGKLPGSCEMSLANVERPSRELDWQFLGSQLGAGSHGPVPGDSEVLQRDEGLGIHREPGDAGHLSEGPLVTFV